MCRSTGAPLRLLTLALAGLSHGRPSDAACPPSCPVNELSKLYDQYCSDKGTFWQSKHHYASAYHQIFGSIRNVVTSILEIGIGEDTAPSVASWLIYFPKAHIYPIDIKTTEEVAKRAVPGGATDRVVAHQAKFGCEYNRSMWSDPRVHLTLNTDASDPAQLSRVRLPPQLDIILDDGSHRFLDQEKTLHVLWPRLRPGGFYIIEDILIGALPWDASHAQQAPTNNSDCGGECFFPQKIAEHPFLLDRFGHTKGGAWTRLRKETQELLRKHDWFFSVTGVHKGGGLDVSLILRKAGPAIGSEGLGGEARPLTPPSTDNGAALTQARSALQLAETQQKSLERQHSELQQSLRSIEQAVETRCTQQEAARPADEGSSTVMYALLAASVALNCLQFVTSRGGARGYRRVPNRAEGF
mmetsp:Transcript_15913/g.47669  ORF Transcript_15913/g.47669 Transcript_15913/m.47669 type:complete len:413 (-) Transcript_15913:228-1466(-)